MRQDDDKVHAQPDSSSVANTLEDDHSQDESARAVPDICATSPLFVVHRQRDRDVSRRRGARFQGRLSRMMQCGVDEGVQPGPSKQPWQRSNMHDIHRAGLLLCFRRILLGPRQAIASLCGFAAVEQCVWRRSSSTTPKTM